MEVPPKSSLLEVSCEEMWKMRKSVGYENVDSIKRDVDMIVEWFKKQPHLPRIQLDRGIVERVLISRKGSVEQTKQKIDLMFSLRTLIPDLASPRDILHPDIQRFFKAGIFAVMPKLNDDMSRINILRYSPETEHFVLADTMKYIFLTMEYRMKLDYSSCDRYVMDFENIKFGHFTKVNPIVMKNAEVFVVKGYSNRIFGVHFVNAPSIISSIVSLFKSALTEKIGNRILVHQNHEDLHKHISKQALPEEYGGECGPIEKHCEAWKQVLAEDKVRAALIEQASLRADESLRNGKKILDNSLGIAGSFKQLSVD